MKKVTVIIMLLAMMCIILLTMDGCGNRQILDITYTYDKAILSLPNGEVIEGEVDSWRDYDGDSIQVVIDGNTYYTHIINVVMISEG